jgi:hypothetical protein
LASQNDPNSKEIRAFTGTSILPMFPSLYLTPCIEPVLFGLEWQFWRTERSLLGCYFSQGTNSLVGTDPGKIVAAARDTLAGRGKAGRIPPLWDGHAAKRIVDILLKELARGYAP